MDGDKVIGIVKGTVAAVIGVGTLVVVARYQSQLGAFLNSSAGALVTLGNGVAGFGGSSGTLSAPVNSIN